MLVTKLQNYFVLLTSFANILKQKMQEIYLKTIAESSVDVAKRRCLTVKS